MPDTEPSRLAFTAETSRGQGLARLREAFRAAGLDTPALDARILSGAALEIGSAALLSHPETPLGGQGASRLAAYAERRLAREPVSRILGRAEFWGLPFRLSAETLVPRPDTETVVRAALDLLRDPGADGRMLDLGTGSGCILVALLHERPAASGLGLDRSPGALATARLNADDNGVGSRATFAASNWADALGPATFDLIVANPPYIPSGDMARLDPEVARHDPALALDGGPDGLAAFRDVFAAAGRLLSRRGALVVEIGQGQALDVGRLASGLRFTPRSVLKDLGGHARALVFDRA